MNAFSDRAIRIAIHDGMLQEDQRTHARSSLETIDVYRVLKLFGVTDPCLQHAAKKMLCAGNRGHKDLYRDVQDAIDSLERWKEMYAEDVRKEPT